MKKAKILEYMDVIKKALQVIEEQKEKGYTAYDEFEWSDVGVSWRVLNKMVEDGLLVIRSRSNKHTFYAFPDLEEIKTLVKVVEDEIIEGKDGGESEDIEIPDDLFDFIVGYDGLKELFLMSLKSGDPVHILMHGPPATGKTAFMMELERIGGKYFAGSGTSNVGLTEWLIEHRPKIVLIDEIDKMNKEDYTVLLTLCEDQRIVVDKHNKHIDIKLKAWVFAACNNINRIPPEVQDRFMKIKVHEYSDDEFKKVVTGLLTKRYNKDEELAKYIAERTLEVDKSIREAVRIAKLSKSKEDVDKIINILKKYR